MELLIPPVRGLRDGAEFWKLVFAFLALIPAWKWLVSENSAEPTQNCGQVQTSCGYCHDIWSSNKITSQGAAAGDVYVPESYLQHVTLMMPNASCPWPVLYTDSMQQYPVEAKSTEYQQGAAIAFVKCTELARGAGSLPSHTKEAEIFDSVVGVCEIEVADASTQKRRKYLVELPEDFIHRQQTPSRHPIVNATCPGFAECCEGFANSSVRLPRLHQPISASSAYLLSLFEVDLQQETCASVQKFAALTTNFLEISLDAMWRLIQTVDTMMGLRLYYQRGFLDHLNNLGNFCRLTTRSISVPTTSANKLLPQRRVWSFRRRAATSDTASPAEYTPKPAVNLLQGSRQALD